MKTWRDHQSLHNQSISSKEIGLILVFTIGISALVIEGCARKTDLTTSNTNKNGSASLETAKPSNDPDSKKMAIAATSPPIEFLLNLTPQEKEERSKRIRSFPLFTKAAESVRKLGFNLSSFEAAPGARASPTEYSLTGIIFEGEASQQLGEPEFKVVFMGPTRDYVDTIRIQSWGLQTKQARQRLHNWANSVLASLSRGQLPQSFLQKLYAGENVGDDGVFNGFCNVQVLQKPSNPSRPSADDRISIDLIFDKTK